MASEHTYFSLDITEVTIRIEKGIKALRMGVEDNVSGSNTFKF